MITVFCDVTLCVVWQNIGNILEEHAASGYKSNNSLHFSTMKMDVGTYLPELTV
jgi:hypothetical protein